MRDISCKLLVIGAGPGGYVCAIRAGQLGIDTVVVEANKLGGTCLNIGCIPSKALIHAADEFARVSQFASGESPLGISLAAPRFDLARTMQWKDGIVGRLTGGVSALLKKANVKIVEGWARFLDGKTVEVETEIGVQVIRAEHVVIATGSKSCRTSGAAVRWPGDLVNRGAVAEHGAAPSRRGRCRLYRAGTGNRIRQAGRRGDRDRGAAAHPAAIRRGTDAPGRRAPARAWHHGADRCQSEGAYAGEGRACRRTIRRFTR